MFSSSKLVDGRNMPAALLRAIGKPSRLSTGSGQSRFYWLSLPFKDVSSDLLSIPLSSSYRDWLQTCTRLRKLAYHTTEAFEAFQLVRLEVKPFGLLSCSFGSFLSTDNRDVHE